MPEPLATDASTLPPPPPPPSPPLAVDPVAPAAPAWIHTPRAGELTTGWRIVTRRAGLGRPLRRSAG